jgi:hypothetical protein
MLNTTPPVPVDFEDGSDGSRSCKSKKTDSLLEHPERKTDLFIANDNTV